MTNFRGNPFFSTLTDEVTDAMNDQARRPFGRTYDQGELTPAKREELQRTIEHIARVQELLGWMASQLFSRAMQHDDSKLQEPELSAFAAASRKLSDMTYGSEEYEAALEELDEALDHHYAHNRHHPEHHDAGIAGMNLVDLVEMLVDWKAASERHDDGDLYASIEHNTERFDLSPQLRQILTNTAQILEDA